MVTYALLPFLMYTWKHSTCQLYIIINYVFISYHHCYSEYNIKCAPGMKNDFQKDGRFNFLMGFSK